MKYQLGDIVLLLHSNEEGEIVGIINNEMILVEVDGIRFPVYLDQIDFPYFKRFTEKKVVAKKKENVYIDNIKNEKTTKQNKVSTGIWLSFFPLFDKEVFDDDVVQKFKIYLLNQTEDEFNFLYWIKFKGASGFDLSNSILPFSDFYLHDIPFEEMNDAPKFEFTFTLAVPNKNKAANFKTVFKIKAKQLFKKIENMRLKNEPSFSFLLMEKYPDISEIFIPDYQPSSENFYNIYQAKLKMEPAKSVVDLHIEKLTDNWKGLSNFELLTLQLNAFEKYYNLAVGHRQPNLIVVHGLGTGKLRNEIHEILKLKKEVGSFANQYHSSFGFGATEIFFQY